MWQFNYNELYHYGIPGMKWGVRRTPKQLGRSPEQQERSSKKFKNFKDGLNRSLSETIKDGKDKPPISKAEKIAKDTGKIIDNTTGLVDSSVKIRNLIKGKTSMSKTMTNQQLKEAIERMNLERTYDSLKGSQQVSKGAVYVKEFLSIAGSVVGIAGGALGIAASIKSLMPKR